MNDLLFQDLKDWTEKYEELFEIYVKSNLSLDQFVTKNGKLIKSIVNKILSGKIKFGCTIFKDL